MILFLLQSLPSRIGIVAVEKVEMGRTIPSFRIALEMEKKEWKLFRNALDKKDRKDFDEMFEISRF